jgi:ubiquinone/menaquinone biosynthesis C-methylase UbiE
VKEYYDTRATEYDEWYLGLGKFAHRDRPGWSEELRALEHAITSLPPADTLDAACGTGFLTRHLRGRVTALDQSAQMLEVARERLPAATLVRGDALELPFADRSFERVFTGHFYGHLDESERAAFTREAFRVADEVVVADSAVRPDHAREEWQARELNDGSRFRVYKRYFDGAQLAAELGGERVLHDGQWFVMVMSERCRVR